MKLDCILMFLIIVPFCETLEQKVYSKRAGDESDIRENEGDGGWCPNNGDNHVLSIGNEWDDELSDEDLLSLDLSGVSTSACYYSDNTYGIL